MLAKRHVELLSLALLGAVLIGLSLLFGHRHLDRSFVAYRYARHLASGQGFAYNPGQPGLSEAVAPLHVVLLALGGRITSDLPRLGNLIGIAGMALGVLAIYLLAHPPSRVTAAAAGLYALFPLLWLALGLDAPLWMALGLLAVWMHGRGWPVGAAAMLALATLTRPEIGALAAVLVTDAVISGRPLKLLPAGVYAGVVAAGLLWLMRAVGSGPLLPGLPGLGTSLPPSDVLAPEALTGLGRLAKATLALSPLWAAAAALAAVGAARLAVKPHPDDRWVRLLAGWAVLHVAVLLILGAAVYPWHYAPLIPALAALTAVGAQWLVELSDAVGVRWAVGGICALLVAGAAVDGLVRMAMPAGDSPGWAALSAAPVEAAYSQAGAWLRDNTPPGARVGSTQIGLLGYVSGRPLIDYEGRLQPDIAQAHERGDAGWWLGEYVPEYLVLRTSELEALDSYAPAQDPWFRATYTEVARAGPDGELVILARTSEPPPLIERFVGLVSFPNGIVLNGIATDFPLDPLEGGRMGRVRLEWLLNQPYDAPLHVSIRIEGRGGTVAALNGRTVDFSTWPVRRLITTYHTLDLAPGLQPGVYDLLVGIGPDAFNLTYQPVAVAKIPFPEAVFVGGVSGARTEFGSLALLGYRLARTPEGLEVLLLWQAIQTPLVDYRVFIQVRDMAGGISAQM